MSLNKLDNSVVVVLSADDNYAMASAVVAVSALENLRENYNLSIFIIDGGIKSPNKQKILNSLDSERCQVNFIKKPDRLPESILTKDMEYNSIAAYYRLFIPELLPTHLERVIYLDCDLVVNHDLGILWETDFGDNYVLAAQDMWVPYASSRLSNPEEFAISPDAKFFNSGVLVINLDKWRGDNLTAKAIRFLQQYDYFDQEVLNILLAGHWGALDPRWNVMRGIFDYSSWQDSPFTEEVYQQIMADQFICHFASSAKPWNTMNVVFGDRFFKYLDMTVWSGWRFTLWRKVRRHLIKQSRRVLSGTIASKTA